MHFLFNHHMSAGKEIKVVQNEICTSWTGAVNILFSTTYILCLCCTTSGKVFNVNKFLYYNGNIFSFSPTAPVRFNCFLSTAKIMTWFFQQLLQLLKYNDWFMAYLNQYVTFNKFKTYFPSQYDAQDLVSRSSPGVLSMKARASTTTGLCIDSRDKYFVHRLWIRSHLDYVTVWRQFQNEDYGQVLQPSMRHWSMNQYNTSREQCTHCQLLVQLVCLGSQCWPAMRTCRTCVGLLQILDHRKKCFSAADSLKKMPVPEQYIHSTHQSTPRSQYVLSQEHHSSVWNSRSRYI